MCDLRLDYKILSSVPSVGWSAFTGALSRHVCQRGPGGGDPTPHADRQPSAARALATADCDCRTDPELALPSTVLPRFHTHPSGFRPEILVPIYCATINPELGAFMARVV